MSIYFGLQQVTLPIREGGMPIKSGLSVREPRPGQVRILHTLVEARAAGILGIVMDKTSNIDQIKGKWVSFQD